MTKERAKECLSAFRAYPAEATDTTLREALELASRDSELGDWLSRQQEFDEIFIEKLTSIGPPEGLKENILRSLEAKVHPIQSWRMGWLEPAATIVLAAVVIGDQFAFLGISTQSRRQFRSDALVMVAVN